MVSRLSRFFTSGTYRTSELRKANVSNTVTSQFTADAAVGPFLQVDVLRISSFITAGAYLTSGTKDSVCVNMVTSQFTGTFSWPFK
jgi:hypothetical protein